MILDYLYEQKLIHPPKWLINNTVYLSLMGSQAYGTSLDKSDQDLYGITIPHKEDIFPHLRGEIPGFGRQKENFAQYQEHGIKDPNKDDEYDITVYGIVKYFNLALENNPNIVDSLFVPQTCVLYSTQVGQLIRESRKLFLHRGIYHKLKGYAFAQQHKIKTNKSVTSSRKDLVEKYGYDTKYAMHLFRLCLQCEDVLVEHDLDLQRHKEHLKAVRRGQYSETEVYEWFSSKEKQLEKLYAESTLRYSPDEPAIKQLLLRCLEMQYGSLDECIRQDVNVSALLTEIENKITLLRSYLV